VQKKQENKTGFFKPDSMLRRISQEGVILLGGGYAVLLQLAHPFVAAGVDDYSNFQSEILQRLYRTGLFMQNLVFLDRENALKSIQHFKTMHQRIRGRLRHRAGNFSHDTVYSGDDAQAKLWVHATLVDAALKVYEKFVKQLNTEERRHYYSDSLIMAHLLEIPEEILPKSLEEFNRYTDNMFLGDTLAVTKTTKRLGHAVLYPDVGFFPSRSAELLRFVTAGLLPERIRWGYGLKWSRKRQYLLDAFSSSIRFLRPVAPAWLWQSPFQNGKFTRYLLWKGMNYKVNSF
jgi:uncharacterized protein (DUF2236 family)